MDKTTKTPALDDVNYAEKASLGLKTFEFVHNDKIMAVEAVDFEQAQVQMEKITKNQVKVEVVETPTQDTNIE